MLGEECSLGGTTQNDQKRVCECLLGRVGGRFDLEGGVFSGGGSPDGIGKAEGALEAEKELMGPSAPRQIRLREYLS